MDLSFSDIFKKVGLDAVERNLEDAPVAVSATTAVPPPAPAPSALLLSAGQKVLDEINSSATQVLFGEISALQGYHFPTNLIGGISPRVVGEEEAIVWNAAAEATDTERVSVVWQAVGDKIWYLAMPAADTSSHPHTWCPFAALLPSMKDAAPIPACYTYYSDEVAVMMTATADGLQVHRGSPSVLRVKAERMFRETGDNTKVVDLTPDIIEKLTPVPWYSVSLFEDRARRILAALSVVSSLALAGFAFLLWMLSSMAIMGMHANLNEIKARTEEKSKALLSNLQSLQNSPMRQSLKKFSDLNDGLLDLNGYLEFYRIATNKVMWRATIPSNITANRISEINGKTLESSMSGVVIGSGAEALDFGKTTEKK